MAPAFENLVQNTLYILVSEIRQSIDFDLCAFIISSPGSTDLLISALYFIGETKKFSVKKLPGATYTDLKIINGTILLQSRYEHNEDIKFIDSLINEDRLEIRTSLNKSIKHDKLGNGYLLLGSSQNSFLNRRSDFHGLDLQNIINKILNKQLVVDNLETNDAGQKTLYKAIFDQSPVPSLILEREGGIVEVNGALKQLYGADMTQFIEWSSVEDLFHPRHRKKIIDHYRHIPSERMNSLQVQFQCKNGQERIVELTIQPINKSNQLLATLVNLTGYKINERQDQQIMDQISVINEIVRAINSNLNKSQLIRIFFNQIDKIFGYDLACIALSDIEDKEVEVHFSKDASEIVSKKCIGLFYRSFLEKLESCQQIENKPETVFTIAQILDLQIREEYDSHILIQLKTDEQLIGAVLLFSRAADAFNQYHLDIFEKISDQIAIAFLKARLLQKYQQSLTNLSFLARINESLSSTLDLNVVLKQVVESSLQIIHAKICTIHILKTNEKFTENFAHNYEDKIIDQFKPQIRQVILDQKPLIVENIDYNNIQFFKSRTDVQRLGLKSLIILPVRANKKTIALLSVFGDNIHYFSEHEVELLTILADQAAIAILNAQLFQKLEQTKNYLESIIHSSTHIIVSTDIDGNTTFFNNSARQITGYSCGDVIDRPFFETCVQNGNDIFRNMKEGIFANNKVQFFECELKTKNNKTVPVSWSFSPLIDQKNEIIGALGIGKSISKLRMIQNDTTMSTNNIFIS